VNGGELTRELVEASAAFAERSVRAERVATAIRRYGDYRWVGIYDVGSDEIAVVAWDGPAPPTHRRFPRSAALCGAAVASRRPVVVGDVTTDPRYLTTHSSTRSEILVPVFASGILVDLIDVESERPDAFAADDEQLLKRCAALISPLWRNQLEVTFDASATRGD
jgi:L-methionine (R)-S-oxide reductase